MTALSIQILFLGLILVIILCCQSFAQLSNEPNNTSSKLTSLPPLCPTWFFWNETSRTCDCGKKAVSCKQGKNRTALIWTKCMTYDGKADSTAVADCPYGTLEGKHNHLVLLPENPSQLNEAVCEKANREGHLCSRCQPGYGPAVLSYRHKCAPCSGNTGWLLYLCAVLIPTTVFYIIVVACQICTTSAPLNFFIFASQVVSIGFAAYPLQPALDLPEPSSAFQGILVTFFTMWNLDFFRFFIPPFCVSENLSNMQVLCMDYIIAFYPLFLTVIMYACIQQHARGCRVLVCLWKPFSFCLSPITRRYDWNLENSVFHLFASVLMLSSSKILFVSITSLQKVQVTVLSSIGGNIQQFTVPYYAPNLRYFSHDHLPYAMLAIFVSITFVILPCLLLIVYPTRLFQKFLNCCGIRWHALHAFADAFNGCYKNGTIGTRDYRCFAGFYLLLRVCIIFSIAYSNFLTLFLIWSLFIFALNSPYNNRLLNIFDSFGLAVMTLLFCVEQHQYVLSFMAFYLFIYFVVFVSCKLILKLDCRCSQKLKALGDKMAGIKELLRIEREAREPADVGDDHPWPHRMVDPDEYERLSDVTDEHQSWSNNSTTHSYGTLH